MSPLPAHRTIHIALQQAALIKLTLALLSIITTDSNLYLPNAIQLSNIVALAGSSPGGLGTTSA